MFAAIDAKNARHVRAEDRRDRDDDHGIQMITQYDRIWTQPMTVMVLSL
jgi:hypothetical protein